MRSVIFAVCCMAVITSCATVMNDANQQINFKAPGCKGKGQFVLSRINEGFGMLICLVPQ